MTSNKDDWETPQSLFDALDSRYHFTLDAAASDGNAKCERHYTRENSGLTKRWGGERVFCNPPYGRDIGRWVAKCAHEAKDALVVLLIPARTDTAYFHDFIYEKPGVRIEFLRGRLKFEQGGGSRPISAVPVHARLLQRGVRSGRMAERA